VGDYTEFGLKERAGWSDAGIIDAYVRHFGPITDFVGRKMIEAGIAPGEKVLDLCCGQGTLTAKLAATGADVTGLDFSPDMLALAREAAPGVRIMEGDATAMPFEDGAFDKVLCNFGMMHIADQPQALSEIRRVLRPGGSFAMATWAGPPVSPAFAAVFGAMKAHADFSMAPPQPDLFAFADESRARDMLAAARLKQGSHELVEASWKLDAPEDLFEIFLTATVGARMLIRSQSDEVVDRIARAVSSAVRERHAEGAGYNVPVMVAMLTAKAA
jgi:SAM-dependent methyltransferase